MQKIVVNAKPGGFALSREAAAALGLTVEDANAFMRNYQVIGEEALARDDGGSSKLLRPWARQPAGHMPSSSLCAYQMASTGGSLSPTVQSGSLNGTVHGYPRRTTRSDTPVFSRIGTRWSSRKQLRRSPRCRVFLKWFVGVREIAIVR